MCHYILNIINWLLNTQCPVKLGPILDPVWPESVQKEKGLIVAVFTTETLI